MKKCSTCAANKPLSEFYKNKLTKDGYHGEGKHCNRTRAKNWYKNNPNRSKHNRLKKAYGISFDQYSGMLQNQKGLCAICKVVLANDKNTCVDHNHKTYQIRGILCTHCNFILGHAKDSIKILKSAQKYLQKYDKKAIEK